MTRQWAGNLVRAIRPKSWVVFATIVLGVFPGPVLELAEQSSIFIPR